MKVSVESGAATTSGSQNNTQKKNNDNPFHAKTVRKDKATISGRSPKVRQLQKQKKQTAERRKRLIHTTKQKGEPLSSIKTKLAQFESKMRNLDKLIALALAEEAQQQVEEALEKRTSAKKLQPDPETEQQTKEAGNVAQLSLRQSVSITRGEAEREIADLAAEIERERQQGASDAQLAGKRARLLELQRKLDGIP